MLTFILALVAALFIGAALGMFIMALCVVSTRCDRERERRL